jgi:DNA end-binding protein Ku
MQTVWKGSIAFGLVSIPVRLVSATEEKDVSLRQVHDADGGRIKYRRFCSIDGEEVPYGHIARGYETPDGGMVVLEDADFADLPVTSTRNVEVLSFADADDINPLLLSRAYYADPTGDAKPYVLLHDTLVSTGKVAVVKVALRQKERLALIRAQDGVLVVQTMLWPDEVREVQPAYDRGSVELRAAELDMAAMYVQAFDQGFHPEQYHDDYRDALLALVEAKAAGREVASAPAPEPSANVVDLMAALRASVAAATGGPAPETAEDDEAPTDGTAAAAGGSRTKAGAKGSTKSAAKKTAKKSATKTTKKTASRRSA